MNNNNFEIFCSYAHSDNDDSWVDDLVQALDRMTRKLSGVSLKIFVDRESLITADIWEKKIQTALQSSNLLIAVISPSYIKSEWCRKEWNIFNAKENELRVKEILDEEQGLISPILLYPLERGQFTKEEETFAKQIKKRQWADLSSKLDGTPLRQHQVRHIAEQIIDSISDLARKERQSKSKKSFSPSNQTIMDSVNGIEWSAHLSPDELTFEQAQKYALTYSKDAWRLPTKSELESIIDTDALVVDPESSPFPLIEPFNSQRFGFLHSGTQIRGFGGHYIMNVRNGHIFNGGGRTAFVRLVRTVSIRNP